MKPLFKNKIKVYRAMHNMSQEDLAKQVGVRRETIGNLEVGRYNPSLLLAMDIASIFKVRVEDVFQKSIDDKEENHGQ